MHMMRRFLALTGLLALSVMAQAQTPALPFQDTKAFNTSTSSGFERFEPKKKAARPDLPGILAMDFGFNLLMNNTGDFETRFFGSKVFNLQYKWEKQIKDSKLSYGFGIGLGLDKHSLQPNLTLRSNFVGGERTGVAVRNITEIVDGVDDVKKSTIAANYVDIPLELTYKFKDTYNSFRVTVGGRVGYLYSAHAKSNFVRHGENFQIKEKENLSFERWRYGASIRLGSGGFGGWAYYGLNNLFREGEGPQNNQSNQVQVGLFFNLF